MCAVCVRRARLHNLELRLLHAAGWPITWSALSGAEPAIFDRPASFSDTAASAVRTRDKIGRCSCGRMEYEFVLPHLRDWSWPARWGQLLQPGSWLHAGESCAGRLVTQHGNGGVRPTR